MALTLKKSLGQHFLINEEVCHKILAAIRAMPPMDLLEVGPGGGALTKHLLALEGARGLKAVEFDAEKTDYLAATYPALKDKLIQADFLRIGPPFEGRFAVVGNYPYNISSQILFKILAWRDWVPFSIGMFQKELAQRAAARPGTKAYGILSVLLQAWYDAEYLFDVPPHDFNPPPKVTSGVVKIVRRPDQEAFRDEASFVFLVKSAFAQKRKMLRNNLKGILPAEMLADPYFNKRAEALPVAEFSRLTHHIIAKVPELPAAIDPIGSIDNLDSTDNLADTA